MKAMWQLWSDHLADETCAEIIREAMKLKPERGGVGVEAGNLNYDSAIRETDVRWIRRDHPELASVFQLIDQMIDEANSNAFGVDVTYLRPLQFGTYREERLGHYSWHHDVFWETDRPVQRKLTAVVMLSDPNTYEGGDLELDVPARPDPEKLRKRGTVIVFPSFVFHRVTPVTKGVRHTLVGWKEGPLWR